MKAYCPNCQKGNDYLSAKCFFGLSGTLLCLLALSGGRHNLIEVVQKAFVSTLISTAIGAFIDQKVSPRCPTCGTVLCIIDELS